MSKKWIILLIVSLLTVLMWIVVEFTMGRSVPEQEILDYTTYLTPIEPTFDETSLQVILDRESEFSLIDRNALD